MVVPPLRAALVAVLVPLLVLVAGLVPPAWSASTGDVVGVVVDDGGLPIPGALLTLTSPALLGGRKDTTSDVDGAFAFRELPPGTYALLVQKQGFGSARREGVAVEIGRTSTVRFALRYAGEAVVVVDSRRAQHEQTPDALSADYLSRIPAGRTYQSAVSGAAGVVPGAPPLGPGPGERYGHVGENAVQAVADAPLSTFSIDVDTASYANVRRFLDDGVLPPRDAVRVEELINYFAYADAPPTDGAPFAVHAEVAGCPWAPDHRLLRIAVRGRDADAGPTPPRNLVFLVDVSGSMQGPDRLQLVQRGLDLLVGQLGPRDHVAIVTYAGTAGVVLPPTRGDEPDRIRDAVWALGAGGSTAGAAGILTAYELAERTFDRRGVNRVILATDGDFNVGVSGPGALEDLIAEKRATGVFLSVLGVGRGNLQDEALDALADKGNGTYAYLDGAAELRKVFATEVGGTLETIAKDVKIQVELNPAEVQAYRLIGYENRVLADREFADDTKDAGELGVGHAVTALYELVPATAEPSLAPDALPLRYQEPRERSAAARTGELATIQLRYKAPDGDRSTLVRTTVTDTGARFEAASEDLRWSAAVAAYGMLLRGSEHRGAADWPLVARLAKEAVGADVHGYRAELVRLVDRARALQAAVATRP